MSSASNAEELAEIFAEWNAGDSTATSSKSPPRFFAKKIPKPASRWSMSSSTRPAKKGPASGRLQSATHAIGRHLHDQRRGRSARHFFAQRRARGCLENSAATEGRQSSTGDRDELIQAVRDALYASKIVSYAQGMELLRRGQHDLQLESELRRHRHHLARRLHHSREISQSHRRGLRARSQPAQSAARFAISPTSSQRRSRTGALRFRPRSIMAWRCRLSARRSPISIATGRRACRQICSRRSAISSAPTPTSASISRAFFTPNGSADQPAEENDRA